MSEALRSAYGAELCRRHVICVQELTGTHAGIVILASYDIHDGRSLLVLVIVVQLNCFVRLT